MPDRPGPSIYRQVAELHASAIDQGFLSQLGPRFLELLYEAIDASDSSVLLVETRNGRLCGFASGGTGIGPVYRRLLRRLPALIAALWPVMFSPRKLRRIAELLRHSRQPCPAGLPQAELYSIAVAPAFRGSGVAERLYTALRQAFAEREVAAFRIVVGDSLAPARAFYLRMGAVPRTTVQVHQGAASTVFVDEHPR